MQAKTESILCISCQYNMLETTGWFNCEKDLVELTVLLNLTTCWSDRVGESSCCCDRCVCVVVVEQVLVGGGFFLKCDDFGRMFDNSFPACAFCFKVEISLRTLIPLFRPGSVYNGSASWDNCGRVFPDELCVSSFPDRFPHSAWSPLRLCMIKGVCLFRCNLPPALLT